MFVAIIVQDRTPTAMIIIITAVVHAITAHITLLAGLMAQGGTRQVRMTAIIGPAITTIRVGRVIYWPRLQPVEKGV